MPCVDRSQLSSLECSSPRSWLAAQTLVPGTRVRVTHPGEGTRTGTFVALTADTLEVRFEGAPKPHACRWTR